MTDLTNKLVSNTYKQLILVSSAVSNTGVDTSLKPVQTGDGTNTALQVAVSAIKVTGDAAVSGNVSVRGNLHADDRVCASAFYGDGSNITGVTATIAGNISVSNAVVGGNLQVSGTTTVVGATHLKAAVSVGGAAQFGSTVTVSGAAQFNSTVTAVGAATFKSTVTVENALAAKNNVTVGGTFNVAGTGTFTSKTEFKNDVSVSGRLDVATSASVGGTFRATGNAGFSGAVSVSGGLVVGDTVTILGTNLQAASARVCASAYYGDGSNLTNLPGGEISGNISVNGIIAGGDVSIAGNLTAVGTQVKFENAAVCASTFYGDGSNLTGITASLITTGRVAGSLEVSAALSVGSTLDVGGNVSIGGTTDFSGNISLGDNIKANFGDSDDLQIYHDGSHSRISEEGTGRLLLQTNGDSIRLTKGTSENMAIFTPDGAVELYYDNSKKIETTSTGIDVTGDVGGDTATITGSITSNPASGANILLQNGSGAAVGRVTFDSTNLKVRGDSTKGLKLGSNGSDVIEIDTSGNVTINNNDGGTNYLYLGDTDDLTILQFLRNGANYIDAKATSGALAFRTGSTPDERMRIDSSGNVLIGTTTSGGLLTLAKGTRTLDVRLETSPATGDVGVQLRAGASDFIGIAAGGGTGTGIVIDSSNNVGIGTSSPDYTLVVQGDANTNDNIFAVKDSDGTKQMTVEQDSSGNGRIIVWDTSGNADVLIHTAGNTYFNGGNVGIGTSSPATQFENLTASGTLQTRTKVTGSTASDIAELGISTGTRTYLIQSKGSSGDFVIRDSTGAADRITMDTSGNVGIGSSPSFSTGSGLEIERAGTSTIRLQNTSTSKSAELNMATDFEFVTINSASDFVFKPAAGSEVMRIDTTGVGLSTSAPKEKLDSRGAAVFSGDNSTGTNAFGTSTGLLLSTASDNSAARITAVSNGANNRNLELRTLASGSAVTALTLDSSKNATFSGDVDIQSSTGGKLILTTTDTSGATGEDVGSIDFYSSDASTGSTGVQARILGELDSNGDSTALQFFTGLSTGSGSPTLRKRIQIDGATATNGNISFYEDTGTTVKFYWDAHNERLGIGTSSPDKLLHLAGADTAVIRLENTDTSLTTDQLIGGVEFEKQDPSGAGAGVVGGVRMYSYDSVGSSTYLKFSNATSSSNDAEAMRIDQNLNVGIGKTPSYARLEVSEGTGTTPSETTSGNTVALFQHNATTADIACISVIGGTSGQSVLQFGDADDENRGMIQYDHASDYMVLRTNGSGEDVRIDSDGRVGIGIASLSDRKLAVKSPGVNSAQICLIDASSSNEVWQVGQQADGDGFLVLRTDSGSGTVLFDASGDNYINGGDLAVGNSTPLNKLSVHATATGGYVKDTDTTWNGITIRQTLSNAASAAGLKFETTSTTQNGVAAIVAERVTTNKANLNFLVSDDNGSTYTEALILDGSGIAIFNGPIRNADGSTSSPSYTFTNDTDTGISRPSDNTLAFSTTSDERMRINSSGNIGIETTNPTAKVHIGSASVTGERAILFTNDAVNGYVGIEGSSGNRFVGSATNNMFIGTTGADGLELATNNNVRAYIDSSGNVGIGTTSPGTTLECAGTITANPASGSNILFENGSGAAVGRVTFDGTNLKVRGDSSKGLKLGSNGADVVTIDTSGNTSCSGNLTVTGSISKGSGSFRISHPLPQKSETHDLVHSFIEGPKVDLIYRGKIQLQNGEATINIDEVSTMTNGTFEVLCDDVQCFTTNETGWTAVKGSVSGNILTIQAQENTCTDTISWMVVGERKDQNIMNSDLTDDDGKLIVEPLKSQEI